MSDATSTTVSDELEHWLGGDQPKTLGNLIELFGPRSFPPAARRTSSRL
jgi:hypothetical protein